MENSEKEFDARDALSELMAYRGSLSQTNQNKRSTLFRRVSIGIWLCGIVVMIVNIFVVNKKLVIPTEYILIYLIVLLVSVIGIGLCSYLEFSQDKELKTFVKDPTADILSGSDRMLEGEIKLYAKFDNYPIEALIQTRNFLARKKNLLGSVSSMFVGVLTKVGILPAVFAILIMVIKLNTGNGISLVSIAAFILIGIYIFCFKLVEASVKFDEYQSIISDYVDMRNSKLGE